MSSSRNSEDRTAHPALSPYDVEVFNQQSLISIDEGWAADLVRETLATEGVAGAAIELAVVDDPTIHRVNREHLEHDHPTDVISFLYGSSSPPGTGVKGRGDGRILEGEVVASAETALRQSSVFGWRPEDELCLYIVHGTLHLCGYDDLSEKELKVMRQRERAVLKKFGLTPHYH